MLRQHVLIGALAAVCTAAAVGAQSPQDAGQQQRPAQPQSEQPTQTDTGKGATTTLTGCVYRERDVPGRTPNVAEKAGVLEDYILADVKMSGSQSATGSTPGATGTTGTARTMYKLEQIEDERLQKVVGKRVEVTGRIDAEAGDKRAATPGAAATAPDRSVGPDQVELPEFEVTSMREVSGSCPAKPSAK